MLADDETLMKPVTDVLPVASVFAIVTAPLTVRVSRNVTAAPTLAVDETLMNPVMLVLPVDNTPPTRVLPETFAVPVTANEASGVEVLIPTRLEVPSAKIRSVLTTRPFLTVKSLSAIGSLSPLIGFSFIYNKI
jgi:hypothetical protein